MSWKSTDGGQSWQELSGLRQHDTGHLWQPGAGGMCLHTIILDPVNPQRIYVAISAAGAFRTDDGGTTWEVLENAPQHGDERSLTAIWHLAPGPNSEPDTLYAGIEQLSQVLHGSQNARADLRTLLASQVAFWLMAATDGHAKNFSLHLAPGGRYALPDADTMEQAIDEDHQRFIGHVTDKPRHTQQVDYFIYEHDLRVKEIPAGLVTVAPEVVATIPGFDDELLAALGDREVSIENSVGSSRRSPARRPRPASSRRPPPASRRATWSSSPRSGDTAVGAAGCPTCTSARWIRRRVSS